MDAWFCWHTSSSTTGFLGAGLGGAAAKGRCWQLVWPAERVGRHTIKPRQKAMEVASVLCLFQPELDKSRSGDGGGVRVCTGRHARRPPDRGQARFYEENYSAHPPQSLARTRLPYKTLTRPANAKNCQLTSKSPLFVWKKVKFQCSHVIRLTAAFAAAGHKLLTFNFPSTTPHTGCKRSFPYVKTKPYVTR